MESEKCYAKMQDGSVLYYEKIGKRQAIILIARQWREQCLLC